MDSILNDEQAAREVAVRASVDVLRKARASTMNGLTGSTLNIPISTGEVIFLAEYILTGDTYQDGAEVGRPPVIDEELGELRERLTGEPSPILGADMEPIAKPRPVKDAPQA